ncbi:hypothetical protein JCM30566_04620 [Marinitoga arctica]
MATLKVRHEKRKKSDKEKHHLSERIKPIKKMEKEFNKEEVIKDKVILSSNVGIGWIKIIFSSFNFLISLILTSMVILIYFQKSLIQSILGSQFTLDVTNIILLGVLYLLYSIFEQFNAIYYLKGSYKGTKISAFIKFLISMIMIFSILYLIFRHGIQWFGASLFGNTTFGRSDIFYIPSIVYLSYSVFLSLLSYYDILK